MGWRVVVKYHPVNETPLSTISFADLQFVLEKNNNISHFVSQIEYINFATVVPQESSCLWQHYGCDAFKGHRPSCWKNVRVVQQPVFRGRRKSFHPRSCWRSLKIKCTFILYKHDDLSTFCYAELINIHIESATETQNFRQFSHGFTNSMEIHIVTGGLNRFDSSFLSSLDFLNSTQFPTSKRARIQLVSVHHTQMFYLPKFEFSVESLNTDPHFYIPRFTAKVIR